MDVATVLKNLNWIEEKFKDKHVDTGELNTAAMAQDIRGCIEELKSMNEEMKRYIRNGIELGYIDDREGNYKKYIK